MLNLKQILNSLGVSQTYMASVMGISVSSLNLIINKNYWPIQTNKLALMALANQKLDELGVPPEKIDIAFDEVGSELATDPLSPSQTVSRKGHSSNHSHEDYDMLLRKQTLHPDTKKAFGLFNNPFGADVRAQDDVFMTPDSRYVREALYQTARLGGFIAVVGESGAGKSTLRKDLITRLQKEQQPVVIIEPFILAMEDNDHNGKTLKSSQLADAVIGAIDPLAIPKRNSEAKFRQMHSLLLESYKSGNKHCLLIEEAHALPIPTLKHLKRFYELECGFDKLLSVVLVGQPELRLKLSERNPSVREVVQRCELVTLEPIGRHLGDYIRFKFDRVNKAAGDVFEDTAIDAIAQRLSITSGGRDRNSLLYPLAINNLVMAAMNLAIELGETKVTADIIKEVR